MENIGLVHLRMENSGLVHLRMENSGLVHLRVENSGPRLCSVENSGLVYFLQPGLPGAELPEDVEAGGFLLEELGIRVPTPAPTPFPADRGVVPALPRPL